MFPKSFITTAATFKTSVSQSDCPESMESRQEMYINYPENIIFLKGLLINRAKKVKFDLRHIVEVSGKFSDQKLFIFRPRLSISV